MEMSTEPSSKPSDIPMVHPVQSPLTKGVNLQQGLTFDFKGTSAAELLKNIVTASQATQQNSKKMKDEPFSLLAMVNNGGTALTFTSIAAGERQGLLDPQQNFTDQGGGSDACAINGLRTSLSTSLSVNVNNSENGMVKADGTQATSPFSHVNNNMQTFEGHAALAQMSLEMNADKSHILQQLLQQTLDCPQQQGSFSVSSPDCPRYQSSSSPFTDSNLSPYDASQHNLMETERSQLQARHLGEIAVHTETLISCTDRLRLDSFNVENNAENDVKPKLEWTSDEFENKTGKVARLNSDRDASTALSPSVDRIFNPDSANQEVPSDFTFTKFGMKGDEVNMLAFSNENDDSEPQVIHRIVDNGSFKTPSLVHEKKRGEFRRLKEPILCQTFPPKAHGCELRIVEQPEEQHRARYLTEGSRGAVKSRSGSGFPVVKLFGYTGQAILQIFIGNDSGKVRPHGFYQACKVSGKNSTQCAEKEIDGTNVIEIDLSPSTDMSATVDCVGILKLRNADVEQRIGQAKAKKKSTKARMIFRVTFQKSRGNAQILQVASHNILCTQPIGQPEICKMSLKSCHVSGGEDCYIIGKNFLRGTQAFFQLVDDKSDVLWSEEGTIDKDYFQATHLIVTVPCCDIDLASVNEAHFQVVVNSAGKVSEPAMFDYTTASSATDLKPPMPSDRGWHKPLKKQHLLSPCLGSAQKDELRKRDLNECPLTRYVENVSSNTEENARKRNYPFVAPEALELNAQIQQTPASSGAETMFQLPPGIISEVITSTHENRPYTPMEESPPSAATGNQTLTQSASQESFQSINTSFSVNQLNDDSLNLIQSNSIADPITSWDSKDNSLLQKCGSNDSLSFTGLDFHTHDVFSSHPMDITDNSIKISSATSGGFLSEPLGIQSPPVQSVANNSIVSQFLQNISMALKSSDPMLSQHQMVMSSKTINFNNTIMTPSNNKLVMTTDAHSAPVTTQCNSILKEVLTCSPASLSNLTFPSSSGLHTTGLGTMSLREEIDMDMESALKTLLASDAQSYAESTSSLSFSGSKANTLDLTQSNPSSPLHTMPFTPDPTFPSLHSEMPFSPSDVLTSVSQPDMPKLVSMSHFANLPTSMDVKQSQSYASPMPTLQCSSSHSSQGSAMQTQTSSDTVLPHILQMIASQRFSQDQQKKVQQELESQRMDQEGTRNSHRELIEQLMQQHLQQQQSAGMEQQAGASGTSQQENNIMSPHSDLSQQAMTPHQHRIMPPHPQQAASPSQLQQQYIDDIMTSQNQQAPGQMQHTPTPSPMMQMPSPGTPQYHDNTPYQHHVSTLSPMAPTPTPAPHYHDNGQYQQQQQTPVPSPMAPAPSPGLQYHSTTQYQQQQQQQNSVQMVDQQCYTQQSTGFPNQLTSQADISQLFAAIAGGPQGHSTTMSQPNNSLAKSNPPAQTPTPVLPAVGPQIIICNNPGQTGLTTSGTQGQFGAQPSIVIVPGQGGDNSQMENLLLSILGSMMQPQQQQQQPPQ